MSRSSIREAVILECQAWSGANSAEAANAEFSKSWSTGVTKKSEYSDVPSACQARRPSSTPASSVRAAAVSERFS
jgi:hypothetical protein